MPKITQVQICISILNGSHVPADHPYPILSLVNNIVPCKNKLACLFVHQMHVGWGVHPHQATGFVLPHVFMNDRRGPDTIHN